MFVLRIIRQSSLKLKVFRSISSSTSCNKYQNSRIMENLKSNNNNESTKNYIIFDADIGSDDAWALLMLIRAEEQLKNYKILGITCVHGNSSVDNVAINTLRVLNAVNRTDIPIFKGANKPFLLESKKAIYFHGDDGFGDVPHENEDINVNLIRNLHAVNAMYELVCKYPKQVSFILVAPLTNFAICLTMYSDFAEKVKDIYIMGGNTRAVGNSSSTAEFNFFADPEAAFIVLNKSTCPITILPWETCLDDNIDISLDWRFNVLGRKKSKIIDLLNKVEEACYYPRGFTSWIPCDAIVTAVYLFSNELIKTISDWHATVELSGTHTRGQMVLDHLKNNNNNVKIVEKLNDDCLKRIFLWTAEHIDNICIEK